MESSVKKDSETVDTHENVQKRRTIISDLISAYAVSGFDTVKLDVMELVQKTFSRHQDRHS